MINLNTATAKEIADHFSNEVNNLFFNPRETAEELISSRQMKDLDILWIRVLSSPTYCTDARNKASREAGRKLAGIPFIRKKMELVNDQKMEEVAKRMAADHRTLQQTFSSLVFCHLLITCDKQETQMLTSFMGESFYHLPLI